MQSSFLYSTRGSGNLFTWRAVRNILPARSRLLLKNIQVGNGYYLYGENTEEVWHLLNSCPYFLVAASVFDVQVQVDSNTQDLQAWLEQLLNNFTTMAIRDRELVAAI